VPSKNIGVILLKRQLSRHQPINADALFGGFGCEGSVDRAWAILPSAFDIWRAVSCAFFFKKID
jgi:hypothetical protein